MEDYLQSVIFGNDLNAPLLPEVSGSESSAFAYPDTFSVSELELEPTGYYEESFIQQVEEIDQKAIIVPVVVPAESKNKMYAQIPVIQPIVIPAPVKRDTTIVLPTQHMDEQQTPKQEQKQEKEQKQPKLTKKQTRMRTREAINARIIERNETIASTIKRHYKNITNDLNVPVVGERTCNERLIRIVKIRTFKRCKNEEKPQHNQKQKRQKTQPRIEGDLVPMQKIVFKLAR